MLVTSKGKAKSTKELIDASICLSLGNGEIPLLQLWERSSHCDAETRGDSGRRHVLVESAWTQSQA